MKTLYCAFNVTKQSFINLGVTVADTPFARLRGLLGKMRMRSDEAMWVVPSHGVHTIGLRFPIDVIYLTSGLQVMYLVENLGPLRIPPIKLKCASVLQLPARSIFDSGTQIGDKLMIASPEAFRRYWDAQQSETSGSADVTTERQAAVTEKREIGRIRTWGIGEHPGER